MNEPLSATAAIQVAGLTHRYRGVTALSDVDLSVPEGEVYALLGPNGAGKTTLIQDVLGLRRPAAGEIRVLGKAPRALSRADRACIGYVAEGLPLPDWMRLERLEAFLRPLYPSWDLDLADRLRARFELDSARRLRSLSRGERMKAALLCALAPRPRLLVMDEPFAGMDVMVRDELVRGLLETSGAEGWTVFVASHEVSELEALADRVGILRQGRLVISEPMESLRERFSQVEVTLPTDGPAWAPAPTPSEWGPVEHAGRLLRFTLATDVGQGGEAAAAVRAHLPQGSAVAVRGATLKEIFVRVASADGAVSDAPGRGTA